MRLLKRESNGKVSLTRDMFEADAFALKYAILSHTWFNDKDEISYYDFLYGNRDKPGYRKIKFCLDQTYRDNIEYFWIDTCCIDRANPAEHAASMLAMWRWYANAEKCYVYTLPLDYNPCLGLLPLSSLDWFTRGWTVLELLAPTIVDFYGDDGYLGSKATLEEQISKITGIPASGLRGKAMCEYSVNERKKWLSNRKTRVPQDMIYSSLSLLEISMPITLGEDLESAQDHLDAALKAKYKNNTLIPEYTSRTLEAARSMYERTLKIKEAHLGKSHVSTIETLHNLGVVYLYQEKPAEAEKTLCDALKLREAVCGKDDVSTIESAFKLGWLYSWLEKFDAAEELLLRAVDAFSKLLGETHETTLSAVTVLGRCYRSKQDFKQAEHFLQRSYDAHLAKHGKDHVTTGGALFDLGRLYSTRWQFDKAEAAFREALQLYERELPSDSDTFLNATCALGSVLVTQGKVMAWRNISRSAKQQLDKETVEKEGNAKCVEGRALEAKALKTYEQIDNKSDSLANTNQCLLGCRLIYGDDAAGKEQGAKHCREALFKQEKIVGPKHHSTLSMKIDLAGYKLNQGNLKEAEIDLLSCLEEHVEHYGTDHTCTTRVRFNLAKLYEKQERTAAREDVLLQSVDAGERVFGLRYWYVMISVASLFYLYTKDGRKDDASKLLKRVKAGYNKEEDEDIKPLLDTLDLTLSMTRNKSKKSSKGESSKEKSSKSGWKRILPWCSSSKAAETSQSDDLPDEPPDEPPAYSEKDIIG